MSVRQKYPGLFLSESIRRAVVNSIKIVSESETYFAIRSPSLNSHRIRTAVVLGPVLVGLTIMRTLEQCFSNFFTERADKKLFRLTHGQRWRLWSC